MRCRAVPHIVHEDQSSARREHEDPRSSSPRGAALVMAACGADVDKGTNGADVADPSTSPTSMLDRHGHAPTSPSTLPVVVGVGDRLLATIRWRTRRIQTRSPMMRCGCRVGTARLVSRIDVDTNEVVTVDVGATGTQIVWWGWCVGRCRRWPGAAARPGDHEGLGDGRARWCRSAAPFSGDTRCGS